MSQNNWDILEDIQNCSVPQEVLKDKDGWKRVCQVRGRNFENVKAEVWARLCTIRGDLGVPPGPYN